MIEIFSVLLFRHQRRQHFKKNRLSENTATPNDILKKNSKLKDNLMVVLMLLSVTHSMITSVDAAWH